MLRIILSQRLIFQIAAVSLFLCTGCGGERLYPITLTFTHADGSPVTGGTVTLRNTENPEVFGGGVIGSDGVCKPVLRGRENPGLPAGTYQLGVNELPTPDLDAPRRPPMFARRYSNPSASGLTAKIDGSVTSPIRFVLENEPIK